MTIIKYTQEKKIRGSVESETTPADNITMEVCEDLRFSGDSCKRTVCIRMEEFQRPICEKR